MPYATPSMLRVVENFRQVGFKGFWRQLNYIGDTKAGTLMGTDQHGNSYYQNTNETIWRHRWVDFSSVSSLPARVPCRSRLTLHTNQQHDFNASQVPPEWHSWLSHIRKDAPNVDPIMQASRQPWQSPHWENLTGTPGAYKSYNTVKPKIAAWEPKVSQRA
ncbi:NADH dehydrogenase (ubiquinone) 1 alpha subcomplex subunit 12, partial [Phenoliferia sp. Uapishka_3]